MIEALLQNLETLLLVAFSASALLCAALMIVMRQPMRVAMALISCMVFLGGIYGLVGVHFIAAFQVLIYVGAVMVFMVYVIMLLEVREQTGTRYSTLLVPAVIGFFLLLGAILGSIWQALPAPGAGASSASFGISAFSVAFLSEYWLHFELTSVLLVAAVVAVLAVVKISRASDLKRRHG